METPESAPRLRIPREVWVLGFVSLLMDLGTEMVHSVLPAFLVGTLGAGAATVGLIEGVAESTASVVKVFSGALSDRIGKRKVLAVAGYGLSALVRPLFPLANSVGTVLGARFLDRVGKGVRGAPRDAMLADVTPPGIRGAAFGLRQSLDNIGAIGGPLMAAVVLAATSDDVRTVLSWAVVPAIAAVSLLVLGIREPAVTAPRAPMRRIPLHPEDLRALGRTFWVAIAAAALFGLSRYGEAFLLVRAGETAMAADRTPLVLAWMSVVYTITAWPAGALSDRIGRVGLLVVGVGVFVLANVCMALPSTLATVALSAGLWGLYLGLTQGVLAGLVAETAPADRRGTAFGVFSLVTGATALPASFAFGEVWEHVNPQAALALSSGVALLALMPILALRRRVA